MSMTIDAASRDLLLLHKRVVYSSLRRRRRCNADWFVYATRGMWLKIFVVAIACLLICVTFSVGGKIELYDLLGIVFFSTVVCFLVWLSHDRVTVSFSRDRVNVTLGSMIHAKHSVSYPFVVSSSDSIIDSRSYPVVCVQWSTNECRWLVLDNPRSANQLQKWIGIACVQFCPSEQVKVTSFLYGA